MPRTPFPPRFHFAFKLFEGEPFPPGGTWGDITDGPIEGEEEVLERIIEAFKDEAEGPSRETLRVFERLEGGIACDCTPWALKTIEEIIADRREERGL